MATEFDANKCEYCEGSKVSTCHCCDSEIDCKQCDGTGMDPEQFDTSRLAADKDDFDRRMAALARASNNGGIISMGIMEGGKTIGFEGFNGERLLLKNYRLADD